MHCRASEADLNCLTLVLGPVSNKPRPAVVQGQADHNANTQRQLCKHDKDRKMDIDASRSCLFPASYNIVESTACTAMSHCELQYIFQPLLSEKRR